MLRLLNLHKGIGQLAYDAPDILTEAASGNWPLSAMRVRKLDVGGGM
jgi:hypothetical protein